MAAFAAAAAVSPRPGLRFPSSPMAAAAASPPVSAGPFRRRALCLPESLGLKISRRVSRVESSARPATARVSRWSSVVCESQETATEVPDVTKTTWQPLVIKSSRPVLVEFWAPWCGPCRMIHPVIGNLAKAYEGKLECFKLNTDESPDIATQYGIRSIPTIIIFKNGEKKDTVIGAVPQSTLITCIEKFIEK